MEKKSILVWDLNPPNDLIAPLQALLATTNMMPCAVSVQAKPGSLSFDQVITENRPNIVILVLRREALAKAVRLLKLVAGTLPSIAFVTIVQDGKSDDAFTLLEYGATDFVVPPLKAADLLPRLWRLLKATPPIAPSPVSETARSCHRLLGSSPRFALETAKLPCIAGCDANVLILGETGTGKELFARAIHNLSSRRPHAFVPINCGAVPVDLAESELFGHERGAFTGAHQAHAGVIAHANEGTLFLDEVPSLPLQIQVKLLRFLEEKEYRPLGASGIRRANVRIVAASNMDLPEAVAKGAFRRDLYYRLNVLPVTLPPLRERWDDIPLLSSAFLAEFSQRLGRDATQLSSDALDKLMRYDWPGNIRELEHVIERAMVFSQGRTIGSADILLPGAPGEPAETSFRAAKAQTVSRFEKVYLEGLLAAHQGNITRAAQFAGKNRRALFELIRKHSIAADQFRPNSAPVTGPTASV